MPKFSNNAMIKILIITVVQTDFHFALLQAGTLQTIRKTSDLWTLSKTRGKIWRLAIAFSACVPVVCSSVYNPIRNHAFWDQTSGDLVPAINFITPTQHATFLFLECFKFGYRKPFKAIRQRSKRCLVDRACLSAAIQPRVVLTPLLFTR